MKPCLADVNVWLALLVPRHVHHERATRWFASAAAGEIGLCRIVQLGVICLLGNPAVMGGDAISAAAAWGVVSQLGEDERVEWIPEPPGIDSVLPDLFRHPGPTGKLVGDAYLAAFAISGGRRIVTLDRGFRQFHGLEAEILD
jgi:toxin-antitoxin system PIN domain toxin